MMVALRFLVPVVLLACPVVPGEGNKNKNKNNFSPTEDAFLSIPSAATARDNLRYITSEPHVAGTDGDFRMAAFMAEQFRQAGIPDVSTLNLTVLLNYPQTQPRVTLGKYNPQGQQEQVLFRASLEEQVLSEDDTSDTYWRNHTFHGYGASGDVTAPLVYANYGRPHDFQALENAGVQVQGKIVLVRYGKCFRGLKVMNAQERGAVGVIIYSDPAQDGYAHGSVYPDGPWRPSFGVQRGSVQFNSKCSGDPMRADPRYDNNNTTALQNICGVSSYKELIPRIPSVPMGYADARMLLTHLYGTPLAYDVGGPDFCGGIADIEYHVGPTPDGVMVRLVVNHQAEIREIPNVVGYIPGTLPPEQDMPVLLGNHRDAWVYGAADPNSGTATLIEVAKGLGHLITNGWSPRRSIYLLSWSGEEYGLLGSTGWAELNADKIARAVAYLNSDTTVSGSELSVALSPSLATLWEDVLTDIQASQKHATTLTNGPVGNVRDANTNRLLHHPEHGMLGSGSDYAVFLDHFGIPSLDFELSKPATYGQYHSIYDSFDWMDAYGGRDGEPGSAFELMAFGAKIWGLLALRLADAHILPLDHVIQGESLAKYVQEIEDETTLLDTSALNLAVSRYQSAAQQLQLACGSSGTLDKNTCNEKLGLAERHFLSSEGLPDRPWFKHVLQAPGLYLGYAAQAFPGIQQALDAGDPQLAEFQVFEAAARVASVAWFLSLDSDNTLEQVDLRP